MLIIIALVMCAAVAFIIGGLAFSAKQIRLIHTWLAVLAFAVGVWVTGVLLFLVEIDSSRAHVFASIYYAAAATIAYALYWFSKLFPWRPNVLWSDGAFCITGLYAIALLLSFAPYGIIESVDLSPTASNTVHLLTVGYAVYVGAFVVIGASALCNFFVQKGRKALRYRGVRSFEFGIMAALATIGGSIFNLFLPLYGNYELIWIGPLFSAFFTIYVFLTFARDGMLDVRAAVAQTAAYIATATFVTVLYAAVLYLFIDQISGIELAGHQVAAYLVVSIILAFTMHPILISFTRFMRRVFNRSDYHFHTTVQEFSEVAASEIELSKLARSSLRIVSRTLDPQFVTLYVMTAHGTTHYFGAGRRRITPLQKKKQLDVVEHFADQLPRLIRATDVESVDIKRIADASHAEVIVKLMVKDEHVGLLFLGRRYNGVPYGDKDLQLLSAMSSELAIAIQNGLRFEEIRRFNKRLRKEVNEATKELRISNRQLHHLDEVKDEFLSIASHQLRTPLTSMKGYISMVIDGDAGAINDEQKLLLKEAFASSQRMSRLIEDFLNMTRIQTGRFAIHRDQVALSPLVESEIAALQSTAKARGVMVRSSIDDVGLVLVDGNKLRQVVMNMIDNALFYSHAGSDITVKLAQKGKYIVFEVTDTGIGVPEPEREQLFSKFYRASNARQQRPDGTGVGLYLARRIVRAHKGTVIFRSQEGRGSTFGFKLPIVTQQDIDDAEMA